MFLAFKRYTQMVFSLKNLYAYGIYLNIGFSNMMPMLALYPKYTVKGLNIYRYCYGVEKSPYHYGDTYMHMVIFCILLLIYILVIYILVGYYTYTFYLC